MNALSPQFRRNLQRFIATGTFQLENCFGDRDRIVAVRAIDCLPATGIIGNQMFSARPAFEENVGHPAINTRLTFWLCDHKPKPPANLVRQYHRRSVLNPVDPRYSKAYGVAIRALLETVSEMV